MPERSSDVVEQFGMRALLAGIGGVLALLVAIVLFIFRGDGALMGLVVVLAVAGLAGIGYAIYEMRQIKKVASVVVVCPYCDHKNRLTDQPHNDFACQACYRMIPVGPGGEILGISQVRCGFCNELNFYSAKTEVLLCEGCNREVPISVADGHVTKRVAFARRDDDSLYELVLLSNNGRKTEELISALQHMLALNRNQVKQLLNELPVTLLTGIPRMKAEVLQAQLTANDAVAEFRALN